MYHRTPFGKFAAKVREDRGLLLKDFAERLGVSSSFLSNVEFGRKAIPEGWEDAIREKFALDLPEATQLRKCILRSTDTFRIRVSNEDQRSVLVAFIERQDVVDEKASRVFRRAVGASEAFDDEPQKQ